MPADNIKDELHNQLKTAMEKEIHIMREILANMHQEELSLLNYSKSTWNLVIEERVQMISRLTDFRSARLEATKKLKLLISSEQAALNVTLEQLLPTAEPNTLEILSMRDQIMALIEKMNSQNTRNEQLYKQVENALNGNAHHSYHPVPMPETQAQKKKAALATYPPKQVN